jgi:hypothetical protein
MTVTFPKAGDGNSKLFRDFALTGMDFFLFALTGQNRSMTSGP